MNKSQSTKSLIKVHKRTSTMSIIKTQNIYDTDVKFWEMFLKTRTSHSQEKYNKRRNLHIIPVHIGDWEPWKYEKPKKGI